MTGFECLVCGKKHPPNYTGYTCKNCSGNLDLLYNYKDIKSIFSVSDLKNNSQKNVWRYHPLFPFKDLEFVPPLDMSLTPLYDSEYIAGETGIEKVYLKDDTRLPSASFKDRASSVVMAVAREKGVEVVSCASTGNAGCSWACMGAASGVEVIIYVPESAPRAKIAQLGVYGADVRLVSGTYDEAYDICVEDSLENNYFNRCTGYNPFTREGKKSVSFEIWEQLNYRSPGSVIVPVGDGNIISGVWKGFRDLKQLDLIEKMPKIIAVQSANSDAITRTLEKIEDKNISPRDIKLEIVKASTVADSIAVDEPRDGIAAVRSVLETAGRAVRVTDEEIIENISYLAENTGIFAEPAGVTSVAGLRKLAGEEEGKVMETLSPAVCLLTGNGLKDVDAVLKDNE